MADLALVVAEIAVISPLAHETIIRSGFATEAITKGEPVYALAATGKLGVADANSANKQQVRGIALQAAAAGAVFDYLIQGVMEGYTLTSQSYDDPIFLSDAAGSLADAAGTLSVPVGVVVALPQADKSLSKALYIQIRYGADYA